MCVFALAPAAIAAEGLLAASAAEAAAGALTMSSVAGSQAALSTAMWSGANIWANVSGAYSVLSGAASAIGSFSQGRDQSRQSEYQAQVAYNNSVQANNNAIIQERAADDARARGRIEEQQQRLRTSQVKGAQRNAFAASGVQVDSGSALDVLGDTAMFGEMDALTIRSNAEREAYGHEVGAYNARAQGQNYISQSGLYKMQGSAAARKGLWDAGGSLLSGAGQLANNTFKVRSGTSSAYF